MGNTLLPIREGFISSVWLGLCYALFRDVRVKASTLLETVSLAMESRVQFSNILRRFERSATHYLTRRALLRLTQ
jgi:hypothetical protein